MADKMLIDGLIKFCDEKSKNIKLKAEPQVFIEIKQALEELKNLKPSKKGFITIGQTVEDFEKEIRAKAIDDYMNALCDKCMDMKNECYQLECPFCSDGCDIVNIAEQLKAGGEDGNK